MVCRAAPVVNGPRPESRPAIIPGDLAVVQAAERRDRQPAAPLFFYQSPLKIWNGAEIAQHFESLQALELQGDSPHSQSPFGDIIEGVML